MKKHYDFSRSVRNPYLRKGDLGREILEGIREIKSGEHGRVTTLPSVASIREKTVMHNERMSSDDAERLNVLLLQIQARLSESVGFIRDHDSAKSFESYRRVVAEILTTLHLDVQERLWRDYPQLRPEFLNGPYRIDPKIYEPPFYEAAVDEPPDHPRS